MTSNRPYLLRAFYDWLLDNQLTPYIVVDAARADVEVPKQFIQNGQVVLDISPNAVVHLDIGLEALCFDARFTGRTHRIVVPIVAVLSIYAQENGTGAMFEPQPGYRNSTELPIPDTATSPTRKSDGQVLGRQSGKPFLRVIK